MTGATSAREALAAAMAAVAVEPGHREQADPYFDADGPKAVVPYPPSEEWVRARSRLPQQHASVRQLPTWQAEFEAGRGVWLCGDSPEAVSRSAWGAALAWNGRAVTLTDGHTHCLLRNKAAVEPEWQVADVLCSASRSIRSDLASVVEERYGRRGLLVVTDGGGECGRDWFGALFALATYRMDRALPTLYCASAPRGEYASRFEKACGEHRAMALGKRLNAAFPVEERL